MQCLTRQFALYSFEGVLRMELTRHICNVFLIKVNRIGSVLESIDAVKFCKHLSCYQFCEPFKIMLSTSIHSCCHQCASLQGVDHTHLIASNSPSDVSVCVSVCMEIGGGLMGWWWATYTCTYEYMFVVVC